MFIEDTSNSFYVIWDLGRRCTYACSYCPPHRNNKTSKLMTEDVLKDAMNFVDQYVSMYDDFKTDKMTRVLSFTGGEPTVHPDFWKLAEHVHTNYPNYKFNLTTNGAFGQKQRDLVKRFCNGGTISYHPEGKQDELVFETIKQLRYKVNVMFHKDYFDKCVDICKWLEDEGIQFAPRRIGDDGDDEHSRKMGYTHSYNEEQEQWFSDYFKVKDTRGGRACCSGRCMNTEQGEKKFLESTNFDGWSCSVNWQFLYLNQETRDIFTHQTCQVNFQNQIGPIGSLDNWGVLIEEMQQKMFVERKMPLMKCPKTFCGCGLCADKADDFSTLKQMMERKTNFLDFEETEYNSNLDKTNSVDNRIKMIQL